MDTLAFPDLTQGGLRASLEVLKKRAVALETQADQLYQEHPFTREAAEVLQEGKYADDKSWVEARDANQEFLFNQNQKINAEISQVNRERGDIYLRLLSQRLQQSKAHFDIKANLEDKKKAAQRVFGKRSEVDAFDTWLNGKSLL